MRVALPAIFLGVGVAVIALGAFALRCKPDEGTPPVFLQDLPVIVLAAPDAEAWVRLERASGAAVRLGTLDELVVRPAGIVTGGAQLSSADHYRLHAWVDQGGKLMTPHRDLLAGLGIARAPAAAVSGAPIPGSELRATWPQPLRVAGLVKGKGVKELRPIVVERGTTMAGEAVVGRGLVLALAIDPMADGRAGYELFPRLGRQAAGWLHAPPGPQRFGAEIYVDPGSLPPELRTNPIALADRLARVRAAHIAAWNFGFRDAANDYDYASLIDALHARGVLAYAWMEPPFVNLLMWEDHPECREKTATGRDAMVDWRALIALEDPVCFALAWEQWQRVLTRFDWDGVNVAELYFEPNIKQDNFTPFHPSALVRFGGDPAKDLEAFFTFRTNLVVELNERLFAKLGTLPRAGDLDFELTVIDDTLDPVHGKTVGSDVRRLAEVARRHGASLQIEDPFTVWTEGPLRYDRLVPAVTPLMPSGRVFLDLNVVLRDGAFPTAAMTGAEFDLAAMAASRAGGRFALFSAATVAPEDLANLAAAMAGSALTPDEGVIAESTVVVHAPGGTTQGILAVDGHPWPAAPGQALVPKGEHRLEWSEGPPAGPALLAFTGELGYASVAPGSVTVHYDSTPRAYMVIDRLPVAVELDGQVVEAAPSPNPSGGFTLRLPGGAHEVTVRAAPSR